MPSTAYDVTADSLTLKQVIATGWQPNLKHARAYASGAVAASQVALVSGEDVISISSCDLAGIIGGVSATAGLVLSSSSVVPYQARANGGTFQGDGAHHTLSFVNGLLVPTEISATQDSEEGAVCKLECHVAAAAGQTYPITLAGSATLSAASFVGMYDLGPIKIGSTFISGVKSTSVKFGLKVQKDRYGGEVWPLISGVYIVEIVPTLEVTFEDLASATTAGVSAATATTAVQFFRKRTAGGAHVADATTGHVACTLTGGMHMIQSADANGMNNTSLVRRFEGLSWAFSSSSAIS